MEKSHAIIGPVALAPMVSMILMSVYRVDACCVSINDVMTDRLKETKPSPRETMICPAMAVCTVGPAMRKKPHVQQNIDHRASKRSFCIGERRRGSVVDVRSVENKGRTIRNTITSTAPFNESKSQIHS
ncbi:hypothetical protein JDV02_010845 [Purpureocillium takamizusanense]|uniref:Uncharacterized protein n=1 Tax=Purpureocillium takamizusanense TaxID=2060973 RepID=A0A9Q8QBS3_9HYPO|nr:uncharacterized protein JDV02_010845 [Purpureocillium takamizusanense]UNI16051.1 hypothetical protein JDV02_010845 [Purpureocillium takamizusanense]